MPDRELHSPDRHSQEMLPPRRRRSFFTMPFIGRRNETAPGGGRFISMRLKLVAVLAVTGAAVMLAYLILVPVVMQVVRSIYMQPTRVDARMERYISKFAAYVAEDHIRSDDTAAVVNWTRLHRWKYLTVFTDADDSFGAADGELWQGDDRPNMTPFFNEIIRDNGTTESDSITGDPEKTEKVYEVRFANGYCEVAVVDYSMSAVSDGIVFGGLVMAVIAFLAVMLLYAHRLTRAIVTLSDEVETISGGDLNGVIVADRNDELGRLAEDVDTMRHTIIEKMEERREAWQANSDLLTSMTHDIRSPLTALLGYMELLSADNANMTEEQRTYIRVCTTKAEQIKGLSDKLFLYFWAYNDHRAEASTPTETVEAALLLSQLIGDYIPTVEAAGLTVETDLGAILPTDLLSVSIEHLRRITDNLFDNAVKYADKKAPLTVTAERGDHTIALLFRNAIADSTATTPSGTRIGIKTCQGILSMMGGRFDYLQTETTYTAVVTLPLLPSSSAEESPKSSSDPNLDPPSASH